jgi:hypothetical protein
MMKSTDGSRTAKAFRLAGAIVALALVLAVGAPARAATCSTYPNMCLQTNNGATGHVLAGPQLPKVYLVFWYWTTSDFAGEQAIVTNLVTGLGGTRWFDTVSQYYGNDWQTGASGNIVDAPSIFAGGYWDTTDPFPLSDADAGISCTTEIDSASEAVRAISYFTNYGTPPTSDDIIVVLWPPQAEFLPADNAGCGLHDSLLSPKYGTSLTNPFIVLGYLGNASPGVCYTTCTTTACSLSTVLTHELAEVYTDLQWEIEAQGVCYPLNGGDVDGWSDEFGLEISDKCQPPLAQIAVTNAQLNASYANPYKFNMPMEWSNDANQGGGACVASYSHANGTFAIGTDGNVYLENGTSYHSAYSGAYSGYFSVGKPTGGSAIASDPGAVYLPNNGNGVSEDLVAVRTADNHVWIATIRTGSNSWTDITNGSTGYTFTGSPDITTWGAGRYDIFMSARNNSTGNTEILQYWWDGAGGNAWKSWGTPPVGATGYTIVSSPAAANWGPGRIDVFVHATWNYTLLGSTHVIMQFTCAGAQCSPAAAQSLYVGDLSYPSGVTIAGDPDAASWLPGRYDIMVTSTTGLLYQLWFDQTYGKTGTWKWNKWASQPPAGSGGVRQNPTVIGMGDSRLLVGAVSASTGDVWQELWNFEDTTWVNTNGVVVGSVDNVSL